MTAKGARFLYRDLETLQVDFPQSPLRHHAVPVLPVILLIIADKVLDGGSHTGAALHTPGNGRRHLSGQAGILGIVFKIPPQRGFLWMFIPGASHSVI